MVSGGLVTGSIPETRLGADGDPPRTYPAVAKTESYKQHMAVAA